MDSADESGNGEEKPEKDDEAFLWLLRLLRPAETEGENAQEDAAFLRMLRMLRPNPEEDFDLEGVLEQIQAMLPEGGEGFDLEAILERFQDLIPENFQEDLQNLITGLQDLQNL